MKILETINRILIIVLIFLFVGVINAALFFPDFFDNTLYSLAFFSILYYLFDGYLTIKKRV